MSCYLLRNAILLNKRLRRWGKRLDLSASVAWLADIYGLGIHLGGGLGTLALLDWGHNICLTESRAILLDRLVLGQC